MADKITTIKKLTHEIQCLKEDIRLLKIEHGQELNKYTDIDDKVERLEHKASQLDMSYRCMKSRAERSESVISIIKSALGLRSQVPVNNEDPMDFLKPIQSDFINKETK